ncbi:MAG: TRL domain-containing protein [Planctomycetota bacterium]
MIRWFLLTCVLTLCSGCVFVDVKTPLDTDLNRTQLGSKEGRAHSQVILGLIAWGDAGTQAAAAQGGITTINHADMEVFSILGPLYSKQTLVVYGD